LQTVTAASRIAIKSDSSFLFQSMIKTTVGAIRERCSDMLKAEGQTDKEHSAETVRTVSKGQGKKSTLSY
jgi:hypothetical protein